MTRTNQKSCGQLLETPTDAKRMVATRSTHQRHASTRSHRLPKGNPHSSLSSSSHAHSLTIGSRTASSSK
jgi:hypothetical protein